MYGSFPEVKIYGLIGTFRTVMADHPHHLRALIGNLRQSMPFWRKLRRVLVNSLVKIRTCRSCCASYGQPGC